MRILIVEDDFVSRRLMQEMLDAYGDCDIAVDGEEAVNAFKLAMDESKPYDLICFDIMMPKKSGQQALREIRQAEEKKGISQQDEVKVIMTSALGDPENVVEAFYTGGATSYLVKPIKKSTLLDEIRNLGLLPE